MKVKRTFNWYSLLGDNAYTAQELAKILDMNLITLRRYLRFAENAGTLVVNKRGRFKLYVAKEAYEKYLSSLTPDNESGKTV